MEQAQSKLSDDLNHPNRCWGSQQVVVYQSASLPVLYDWWLRLPNLAKFRYITHRESEITLLNPMPHLIMSCNAEP